MLPLEIKNATNPMFAQGLTLIDIISRIFGLTDVLSNPGNFCIIYNPNPGDISGFKIIDFNLAGVLPAENLLEQFLNLRGENPKFSPVRDSILIDPPLASRIDATKKVFLPRAANMMAAIRCALTDVTRLRLQIPSLDMSALNRYIQSVIVAMREFNYFFKVDFNEHVLQSLITNLCQHPDVPITTNLRQHPSVLIGANYHTVDVPDDGNCGVWAIMLGARRVGGFDQGINVLGNGIAVANDEQYVSMNRLRQDATASVQNSDQRTRIGGNATWRPTPDQPQIDLEYWLQAEDFGHFARALGRPIVLQAAGMPNAIRYNPDESSVIDQFDTLARDGNLILIYHDGVNHYQAIVPNEPVGE
jgi:hypothetical protein